MLRAVHRPPAPRPRPRDESSGLLWILGVVALALLRMVIDVPSLDLLFVVPVLAAAWYDGPRNAGFTALVAAVAGHGVWLVSAPPPSLPASTIDLVVRFALFGGLAVAVCARRRAADADADVARLDPLTGALTRRGFYDRLLRPDGGLRDEHLDQPAVAVFADLDGLKAVNDRCGHEEGDRVIRALADACATAVVGIDPNVVARFGGDEIVILLPHADAVAGRLVAERILAAFSTMTALEDGSVSIGIATTPALADIDELLRAADRAMYEAKRFGGDHYRMAEALTIDASVSRWSIEHRHPQPGLLRWTRHDGSQADGRRPTTLAGR